MGYQEHDEDCDKVTYEGGLCTCYVPSETAQLLYGAGGASDAANERFMEDYQGPELDY